MDDSVAIQDLIAALDKNTDIQNVIATQFKKSGASGKGGSGTNKKTESARNKSLSQHADGLRDSFRKLGGGSDDLLHSFKDLLRGFVIGKAIADVVDAGEELVKSYRKMADIGETFNGSMFAMAQQAGESGLTLDHFTRLLERNSSASAALAGSSRAAGQGMGGFQMAVRDNMRSLGFYGMSLDEVGDLTSDYVETLRIQGRASRSDRDTTSKNISSFAADISAFAAVTGKSRKQIAEDTAAAMRDVALISAKLSDTQLNATNKATSFFASLPGTAGKELSKMLTQSVGNGSSIFTEMSKTFTESGGADFLSIMDGMAGMAKMGKEINPDIAAATIDKMNKWYANNEETFHIQAMAGNAQAAHIIEMFAPLKNLTGAELKNRMENAKTLGKMTGMLSKVEERLTTLGAHFMESFMKALAPLENTFDIEDTFNKFDSIFKDAGTVVGTWISSLLGNKDVVKTFMDSLQGAGRGIIDFIKALSSVIGVIGNAFTYLTPIVKGFIDGFEAVIGIFTGSGKSIEDQTSAVASFVKHFIEIALALKAFKFALGAVSGVMSVFGRYKAGLVNIDAGIVNVNGGGGGLGDLLGGKGGRGGRAAGAAAEAEGGLARAGRGAAGAAEGVGGAAVRGGGLLTRGALAAGGALGLASGVAEIAGLGFAAYELMHLIPQAAQTLNEWTSTEDQREKARKRGGGRQPVSSGHGHTLVPATPTPGSPATPTANSAVSPATAFGPTAPTTLDADMQTRAQQYDDLADTIAALSASATDPAIKQNLEALNAVMNRVASLADEAKQLQAMGIRRNTDGQNKIVRNQQAQINQNAE